MRALSQTKVRATVMAELAKDINAELDLNIFPDGINKQNLDEFLNDVDLYVDGLDFFALEARRAVFAACAEKGIPAAVTGSTNRHGCCSTLFSAGKNVL